MTTATITSKGQVTIPAEVRRALGVDAGDRIDFFEAGPGRFEVVVVTLPVASLKGLVARPPKSVSVDDMNAAILRHASKERME